ncbi:MAG: hypothetical protein AABW93_03730 [Nanoarchaeota archaeon]
MKAQKRCIDCGGRVSRNYVKRCASCRFKWAVGENAGNWKGKSYRCIDCNIDISHSRAKRCVPCSNKRLRGIENNSRALGKKWKLKKTRKKWSKEATRKRTERLRKFWSEMGLDRRLEIGRKTGEARRGQKFSEERRLKISGPNSVHWNPDREAMKKNQRNDPEYQQWVKAVKKRDKKCRLKDKNCYGYKVVHHIKPWRDYPELRYKLLNGIKLCQFHHPRKRVDEQRLIPIFMKLVGSK